MKEIKTKSGLTILIHQLPQAYSVSFYVGIGAGSRYENSETKGLSHFLEHELFEGTTSMTTAKQVSLALESIGGKSGAWTDKEYVMYYAQVTQKHSKQAIDYLSDILFHSTLLPETIEKEKNIVLEELNRRVDTPEIVLWDSWFAWIWGEDTQLGQSIIGDTQSIMKISREKLIEYLQTFYLPRNMVISIAGNVHEEEIVKYIEKKFEVSTFTNPALFVKAKIDPPKSHIKLIESNTLQNHLMLGFVTDVSYHDPDRFALQLLINIMGGGVSSRIFHKLVYDLGLVYTLNSSSYQLSDTGFLHLTSSVSPENTTRVCSIIIDEFAKLKRDGLTETELIQAKEQSKSELYFSLETPSNIAYFFAYQKMTTKNLLNPEDFASRIDNVTLTDMQRVIEKYIKKENLFCLIRGKLPENSLQEIENDWKQFK